MQAVLSCPVCTEGYRLEPAPTVPMMLKCGHTLCQACITQLTGTPYNKCPNCRGPLDVACPNRQLAEFAEDWWLKRIAELEEARKKREALAAERAASAGKE
jgi:uncharacterized protein YbaR (Trm112 family)